MPDKESGFYTQGCVLTQKRPVLRRGMYKVKNIYMTFLCMSVQYLVWRITVLKAGPLFQGVVYVSKGGCVPINYHKLVCSLIKCLLCRINWHLLKIYS